MSEAATAADEDGDGVSEQAGDCDDADPEVYPGAEEVADGKDNDCDGLVDEGTGGATGGDDNDGDGFTATQGDCDDGDDTVFAGAEEIADGKDNDCDGETDESEGLSPSLTNSASDIVTGTGTDYYADVDNDGYPEILSAGGNELRCYNHDGSHLL